MECGVRVLRIRSRRPGGPESRALVVSLAEDLLGRGVSLVALVLQNTTHDLVERFGCVSVHVVACAADYLQKFTVLLEEGGDRTHDLLP